MNNDDTFLVQSRRQLDDSIETLDATTLSRLNQARQQALRAASRTGIFHTLIPSTTTTAFAGMAVAALIVVLWNVIPSSFTKSQQLANIHEQPFEDIEMLVSDADLELLEDLEFVSWLLDKETATQQGASDAS